MKASRTIVWVVGIIRADAVLLSASLVIPLLVALLAITQSGGDCLQNITSLTVTSSLTSMLGGVLAAREWQRLPDVWDVTTFIGRRERLAARFCTIGLLGGTSGLFGWILSSQLCPSDDSPAMRSFLVASPVSVSICFSSLGYVVGILTRPRAGLFVAVVTWTFLYLDPIGSLPSKMLGRATDALPYVYHFVPRGIELGLGGLRPELSLLVCVYGAAVYVFAWLLASLRTSTADLPLGPWRLRADRARPRMEHPTAPCETTRS